MKPQHEGGCYDLSKSKFDSEARSMALTSQCDPNFRVGKPPTPFQLTLLSSHETCLHLITPELHNSKRMNSGRNGRVG